MKSRIITAIILITAMLLSGCGASQTPKDTPVPAETAAPAENLSDSATSGLPGTAAAAETENSASGEKTAKQKAIDLIGEKVDALYEELGEPSFSDYASSCIGPGEDGELHYDGFVVYTYRESGEEIVKEVD